MTKSINPIAAVGYLLAGLLLNGCTRNQECRVVDDFSEIARWHSAVFRISDADRPGAWCWFQDKRVIVDTKNHEEPLVITGVVTYGEPGEDKRGDIDLYWARIDPEKEHPIIERGRFELDDQLQMDDHASPSFLIRPDGRYLVNWSKHGNDNLVRTRISIYPGDPKHWSETMYSDEPKVGITYTNPRYLSEANDGQGMIFNGIRSRGFDSNFLISNDLGETWQYGGRVLDANDPWPHHPDGGRAYVKYGSDGKSRIHIFATDDHPQVEFNRERTAPGPYMNSIYYAYMEDGKLFRSDGVVIDDNLFDDYAAPPTDMTLIFQDSTVVRGAAMRRGWVCDAETDPDGNPLGIFQMRANDDPYDHRYFFARQHRGKWHVNHMAYAGGYFGRQDQPDYTGLASVDPSNPDVVFISADVDPVSGEPLVSTATGKPQFEIFMGKTRNFGKTWQWVPLTKNSTVDNIRPIVPRWEEGKSLVLWMSGNYPSFYVYDTEILGLIVHH